MNGRLFTSMIIMDFGKHIKNIQQECTNERSKDIITKIAPVDADYFLIKPKHSAFYETALHTLLTELQVRHIIITGIAGNICVLFTANDAYMREYSITIPKDCIASNSDEDNEFALTMMENVLFAEITTEEQIIEK